MKSNLEERRSGASAGPPARRVLKFPAPAAPLRLARSASVARSAPRLGLAGRPASCLGGAVHGGRARGAGARFGPVSLVGRLDIAQD